MRNRGPAMSAHSRLSSRGYFCERNLFISLNESNKPRGEIANDPPDAGHVPGCRRQAVPYYKRDFGQRESKIQSHYRLEKSARIETGL